MGIMDTINQVGQYSLGPIGQIGQAGDLIGSLFGSGEGQRTGTSEQTVRTTPMERSPELQNILDQFIKMYFGGATDSASMAEKENLSSQIALHTRELARKQTELDQIKRAQPWNTQAVQNYEASMKINRDAIDSYTAQHEALGGDKFEYQQQLDKTYSEERAQNQNLLNTLAKLNEPYLQSYESSTKGYADLLGDINRKRMSGEAVVPMFDEAIGRLSNPSTAITFGEGNAPTSFFTRPQADILNTMVSGRANDIANIQASGLEQANAQFAPADERYNKERELAELKRSSFIPSNQSYMTTLQDLMSQLMPMEITRYQAAPGMSGSNTYIIPEAIAANDRISAIGGLLKGGGAMAGGIK